MKTYLFVAALWEELEDFYQWLISHAQPIAASELLKMPLSVTEIGRQFSGSNLHAQDFPLLQFFIYKKSNTKKRVELQEENDNECIVALLVTGVGKVAAAAAVSAVASQIPVLVIKTGCVLGVSPEFCFGDLVFPRLFAQHDLTLGPGRRKKKALILERTLQSTDPHSLPGNIDFDAFLKAESVSKLNLRCNHVACLSGDSFITAQRHGTAMNKVNNSFAFLPPRLRDFVATLRAMKILKENSRIIVDMENAGVVHAALLCNAPVLVLSLVFDLLCEEEKINFYHSIKKIAQTIKMLCVDFLALL